MALRPIYRPPPKPAAFVLTTAPKTVLARRYQWWWQVVDECGKVLADNLPDAGAANAAAARLMAPAE